MARRRRRWWAGGDDDYEDLAELEGGKPGDDRLPRQAVTLGAGDARAHELLATGTVVGIKPIPWGSNYSFVAVLSDGRGPGLMTVYKPRRGEIPLWDFPDGTLYQREYAAFLVAEALGLGFIPPTVIRDGPHGVGTFQLFVEADESTEYYGFRKQHSDELRAIALFDVVSNNADRKAGHCFKGRDGRIWGIDHGLCFNVVPKLRTVIWDFCGQQLPEPLLSQIMEFCTDAERERQLRKRLNGLLHPDEIEAFFVRLCRVVERGELPVLDPYRNVPRGFF
jgi:uncharacterized repeat protein (TIGR03843 family)